MQKIKLFKDDDSCLLVHDPMPASETHCGLKTFHFVEMGVNESLSVQTDVESVEDVPSSGPGEIKSFIAYSVFHAYEMFKASLPNNVQCSDLLSHESLGGIYVCSVIDPDNVLSPVMPYFVTSGDLPIDNYLGEVLPDDMFVGNVGRFA